MYIGKYFKYIFNGAGKILFYPFKINKYVKNKDNFSIEERYSVVREKIIEVMDKMLKVKIQVEGLENLNNEDTYLFTPNHQSMLDPLTLVYLFDKPMMFVSKKEVIKMPIIGKFDYIIDAYFFDRESPRDALKMVQTCKQYLNEKRNVVIFPEGTRTKDENKEIGEYKSGAFKCAYNTGAKIVPVVIDKSYIPLSTKYKNTDKIIKISFLKPISKEEYENLSTIELSDLVSKSTKEKLDKWRS